MSLNGRAKMRVVNTAIIALAGSLPALWAFQSLAAPRMSTATSRDAAVSRCLARAHSHYPGKYWDWGQARGFAYRTCIFDGGFTP
jgi:hypothetical protein